MSRRRVFFMCIALLACLSGNAQDQRPDIAARLNALVSRQFPGTKCPGLFITVATNNEIIFSSALGKYHLIWCTKYRKKILRGRIAERARDLIRQIGATREVVIVRGAVSPDHIHLLLAAPPVLSPAKLTQYIKGRSSRHLQAEFSELQKQYWGQHMWARGYFCATVGAVDEATIKAYIENQRWDEDDEFFKITAPTKP
jgi:putative transposase